MDISLSNPTGRSTQAYEVELGPHRLFFSYQTLIAYDGPQGRGRLENVWGPTTARHINELGLRDFPVVSAEELGELVARTIVH